MGRGGEEYLAADETTFMVYPVSSELEVCVVAEDRAGRPAQAKIMVSNRESEILLSDKLISALVTSL